MTSLVQQDHITTLSMQATQAHIVWGGQVDSLKHKAASELQRYLRLLFDCRAQVSSMPPKAGLIFRLDVHAELGAQNYSMRPGRREGACESYELIGGSSIALLWAVYDLVRQWGVEYLTSGDVLPHEVGPLRLPTVEQMRRPVFKTRAFRLVNDTVSTGVLWSLTDHEKLFDQLVKLRFSTVQIETWPHQPWVHWSFRGVERQEADLLYGMRHVIHERSIGKELFGQLGNYSNPDFHGCESYEDRLETGKRFMHGLMASAQRRGLQCIFGHCLTDFPEEIKRHLPQWSDAALFPPRTTDENVASCLGITLDPSHCRHGHLMTPTNPVYVEMVESWLAAQLQEYPEIDGLFLKQSEFPAGAEDYQHCWDELDERHGLSKHFDLESILEQASGLAFYSQGRTVREAKGAIATMRLLDMILNERSMIRDRLSPSVKIYSSFFSEFLMPVLSHVFDPQRFEFVATVDYLPQRVAERMNGLAFVKDSPLKFHLITTITDDNVGFLPQITTPSHHRSIQAMREYGLSGYWFRQFSISKVEPVMAYLIDAGWDDQATPEGTYRHQIDRICGAASVEPMLRALHQLEQAAPAIDKTISLAFETPSLITKVWESDSPDGAFRIADLHALRKQLAEVLPSLQQAFDRSQQRGRFYVNNLLKHVEFACLYLETICQVIRARQCQDRVAQEESKPPRQIDIECLYDLKRETAKRLADAVELLERATQLWAQTVTDPTDLGTLLGLNVYGLDYLRGKADEFRLKAEVWGFRIV